ncbi:RNA polymerase sigma factor [Salibacter halophilus]|jgi:RNA polymerase sigma-70 factor (ECF subfamily)|uniref:RNA polymerase sigma factor n=1 Tax=Salibacter halophilus TaxID=1803916 RepID=A0A6N6M526_9FLAO|nr:RNA polymerase sigma factor [Salibacter halophilus]KAB1062813.1 RNA polymerase sigma factor [Salibacter halophilus]
MIVDQELIQLCKKEDRKAQFTLYKQCYGILMAVCLRYERNKEDAEELVNMGFLKIVTKLDKYNSDIPFEAWIRRIMINTVIDEFRKRKKEQETIEYTDFDDQHHHRQVEMNDADLRFDAEELELMLQNLPNVTQKVFNLHVIDGYSHKEVSDMLSISVGTSKWHVSNARKLLKEQIEKNKNKASNSQSITA